MVRSLKRGSPNIGNASTVTQNNTAARRPSPTSFKNQRISGGLGGGGGGGVQVVMVGQNDLIHSYHHLSRSKSNGPVHQNHSVPREATRQNKLSYGIHNKKPMTALSTKVSRTHQNRSFNSTLPLNLSSNQHKAGKQRNINSQQHNQIIGTDFVNSSGLFGELNRNYIHNNIGTQPLFQQSNQYYQSLSSNNNKGGSINFSIKKVASELEMKKIQAQKFGQQLDELIQKGKLMLLERDYQQAIKLFNRVIKSDKANLNAKFYRGIAWLDLQKPDKAVQDFEDVLQAKPNYNKTVYLCLSVALRRVHKNSQSVRTLTQAIVKYPRYIDAIIARGQLYLALKKYDKALQDFKSVINLDPNSDIGYLWQGDAHKGNSDNAGAILSYTSAIQVNPCSQSAIQ